MAAKKVSKKKAAKIKSNKQRVTVRRRSSNAEAQTIKAWSFSRLQNYEQCPARAKHLYIDKVQEEKAQALLRGSAIHKEAENYLRGTGALPHSLRQFKNEFAYLREVEAKAEEQWAFDSKWKKTGWYGPKAWLRLVLDANYLDHAEAEESMLCVIDYKTGKVRDSEDQMNLYSVAGFAKFSMVDFVRVELWYLDAGELVEKVVPRKDFKKNQKQWEGRAARMMREEIFSPRPSFKCKWCSFNDKHHIGGPCDKGD